MEAEDREGLGTITPCEWTRGRHRGQGANSVATALSHKPDSSNPSMDYPHYQAPPRKGAGHTCKTPVYVLHQQSSFGVHKSHSSIANY